MRFLVSPHKRAQALNAGDILCQGKSKNCLHCLDVFTGREFLRAMSVVLAAAVYLPAASCFALVPLISSVRSSGRSGAAVLDYDAERESVTVTAGSGYRYSRRFTAPVPFVAHHAVEVGKSWAQLPTNAHPGSRRQRGPLV